MPFRRLAGPGCAIVSVLALVSACSIGQTGPSPVGDPDPGHRSLSALEPVLSAIPAGARISYEHRLEPQWDSCDGQLSTYGWDPVTVDAGFSVVGTAPQVVARVSAAMERLAWTYDANNSGGGLWIWSRQVSGRTATMNLSPPQAGGTLWNLDAEAPPATHPVTGC